MLTITTVPHSVPRSIGDSIPRSIGDAPALVIAITGSLDALTAPELDTAFAAALQTGPARLVADLSGVDYSSSAGLRALLNALKNARQAGGDLRLAALRPNVYKIFDLSGFTTLLQFYPTAADAVASYTS